MDFAAGACKSKIRIAIFILLFAEASNNTKHAPVVSKASNLELYLVARPEITSRRGARAERSLEPPRVGLTIMEFCRRWNISHSTFYNWRRAGVAPVVTQPAGPGGRAFISTENEAIWARQQIRTVTGT